MPDHQPLERGPLDGPVTVQRAPRGNDLIVVTVAHGGDVQTIVMSEFNARRAFGMLSLVLELPLPPKVGKAIKL